MSCSHLSRLKDALSKSKTRRCVTSTQLNALQHRALVTSSHQLHSERPPSWKQWRYCCFSLPQSLCRSGASWHSRFQFVQKVCASDLCIRSTADIWCQKAAPQSQSDDTSMRTNEPHCGVVGLAAQLTTNHTGVQGCNSAFMTKRSAWRSKMSILARLLSDMSTYNKHGVYS